MDPHKDIANDLLHNIRLGLIPFALKGTLAALDSGMWNNVAKWIKSWCLHSFVGAFLLFGLKSSSSSSSSSSFFFLLSSALLPLPAFDVAHDYSGFSSPFSSDLHQLHKFFGREHGQLCQVMPLALRSLRAPHDIILAWCVVAEMAVFFYSPTHQRSKLQRQQELVHFSPSGHHFFLAVELPHHSHLSVSCSF